MRIEKDQISILTGSMEKFRESIFDDPSPWFMNGIKADTNKISNEAACAASITYTSWSDFMRSRNQMNLLTLQNMLSSYG